MICEEKLTPVRRGSLFEGQVLDVCSHAMTKERKDFNVQAWKPLGIWFPQELGLP